MLGSFSSFRRHVMLYAQPSGGCFCPVQPPADYGNEWTEEEKTVSSLTLISKGKNSFGDTFYYIRDQNGITNQVYEEELQDFMKRKGVTELREGNSFVYRPQKDR